MSKILTPFERALKEKMTDYEMPYEQGSWFALQRNMSGASARYYPWLVALIATIVVTSGASLAIYRQKHVSASAKSVCNEPRFANPLTIVNTANSESNYLNVSNLDGSTLTNSSNQISLPATQHNQTNLNSSNQSSQAGNATNVAGDAQSSINSSSVQNGGIDNGALTSAQQLKADNVIGFNSSIRQACEGAEVNFEVTNGPKGGSYLWNFGDGKFSDKVNPKHKFAKAGKYDVSLSVTSDDGQINTTVMNDMITIQESPNADFVWEFINTDPSSPAIKIVDHSSSANKYEWTYSGGIITDSNSPVILLNPEGKQSVAVNVINEYGCTDGAVKHISVNSDFNLDAPSTLKVGKDVFMPQGLKQSKVNFTMVIVDQTGTQVFETNSRIKGWDGKLPGGTTAAAGDVYDWKIIITNDINKEQKYFNGKLSIFP